MHPARALKGVKGMNCSPLSPSRPLLARQGVLGGPRPVKTSWRVKAGREQESVKEADAFKIATMRLRHLLHEASWDSKEAVRAELSSYTPAMKLTFLTNCASFATLVGFALSWVLGEDPLGGVTLTSSTINAAESGLIAAMPLVVASLLARTKGIRRMMPLVHDLHTTQAAVLQPLLKDLNLAQLLIASSSTALPVMILALPTMHGVASLFSHLAEPNLVVAPIVASLQESAGAAAAGAADVAATGVTSTIAAGHGLYAVAAGTASDAANAAAAGLADVQNPWEALELMQLNAAGTVEEVETSAGLLEQHPLQAFSLAWALHSSPLTPPMLLPQGVPDWFSMAEAQVLGMMDFDTAFLLKSLGKEVASLAPAVISGLGAAYTVMRQLAPRSSQVRAVRDALAASDRYFKLHMSMSRNATKSAKALPPSLSGMQPEQSAEVLPTATHTTPASGLAQQQPPGSLPTPTTSAFSTTASDLMPAAPGMAAQPVDLSPTAPAAAAPSGAADGASEAVSDAFEKVAVLWLLTRRKVCQLAYTLTALNIMYFAFLWHETGNLATPLVAAVTCVLTELWLTKQEGGGNVQQQ